MRRGSSRLTELEVLLRLGGMQIPSRQSVVYGLAGSSVVVGVLSSWVAVGCSSVGCTDIGCGDAFNIEFRPTSASSVWPAGIYRTTVALSGGEQRSYACETTLPLGCNATNTVCDGDPPFLIAESGCALEPARHAIAGVTFINASQDAPLRRVTVDVTFDGTTIASGEFEPELVESRPNGEDCEPTCYTAAPAELAVALPSE